MIWQGEQRTRSEVSGRPCFVELRALSGHGPGGPEAAAGPAAAPTSEHVKKALGLFNARIVAAGASPRSAEALAAPEDEG